MSELKCTCGKTIPPAETYSFGGEVLCRSCYVGSDGLGPFADQYQDCAKCGQRLHRFAVICDKCRSPVREIGKVESVAKGSATKGILFVLGILALAVLAMLMGDRGYYQADSAALGIVLAVAGFVLGVNGLLGLLYFRFFALVTFLSGLLGFGLGAASFILSVICFILLI
jgi:hypothetical protein